MLVDVKTRDRVAFKGFITSHDLNKNQNRTPYGIAFYDRKSPPMDVTKSAITFCTMAASIAVSTSGERLAAVTSDSHVRVPPKTYAQSQSYPDAEEWKEVVDSEVQSYLDNKVLRPMDKAGIPPGMNIVGSRWVLTIKYNPDGSIEKYKARMVAKGYSQKQGLDYEGTFAPVSQLTTIRIVLKLTIILGLSARHVDVKTAFLNAPLHHEVYMQLPTGFAIGGKQYGRTLKSIYFVKQASHNWHKLQEKFILGHDARIKKSCCFLPFSGIR